MRRSLIAYWVRSVFAIGLSKAWAVLGLKGVFVRLVVSFFASVVFRGLTRNLADVADIGTLTLLTLSVWVGLLLLAAMVYALREPLERERRLQERLDEYEKSSLMPDMEVQPRKQSDGHVGFEIENRSKWDISNCSASLMSLSYLRGGADAVDLTTEVNPNGLLLTWGGGSIAGKKTIHREGGRGLVNIARLEDARLNFIFHGLQGGYIAPRQEQGTYEFEANILGEIDGKSMRTRVIRGFIIFQRYYRDFSTETYSDSDAGLYPQAVPDGMLSTGYYFTRLEIHLFESDQSDTGS
jgi:hypothetical protein